VLKLLGFIDDPLSQSERHVRNMPIRIMPKSRRGAEASALVKSDPVTRIAGIEVESQCAYVRVFGDQLMTAGAGKKIEQ
jgi:hypothetical protein